MRVLFYKFRIDVIAVWNIQPVYMLKGFGMWCATPHDKESRLMRTGRVC